MHLPVRGPADKIYHMGMQQGLAAGDGYMDCPVIRQAVNSLQGFFPIHKYLRLLFPYFTEGAFRDAGIGYGEFSNLEFSKKIIFEKMPYFTL